MHIKIFFFKNLHLTRSFLNTGQLSTYNAAKVSMEAELFMLNCILTYHYALQWVYGRASFGVTPFSNFDLGQLKLELTHSLTIGKSR